MKYLDIVFQQTQERGEKPELEFVEVENAQGHSIAVGRWLDRADGHTVLRLFEDATKSMTEESHEPGCDLNIGGTYCSCSPYREDSP